MTTTIEAAIKEALVCAVRQSEHGVIRGSWKYLANIVAKEFSWPEAKVLPLIMGFDLEALFADSKWVEAMRGLNGDLAFYDKRRPCETEYIFKNGKLFEVRDHG